MQVEMIDSTLNYITSESGPIRAEMNNGDLISSTDCSALGDPIDPAPP